MKTQQIQGQVETDERSEALARLKAKHALLDLQARVARQKEAAQK